MNIVLGVSGGIAAYKTPELVRRLRDIGADVRVILTPNAARFVSPLSLAVVSGHGVIEHQWGDPGTGGVDHIEMARWADLLLIAPATANILAKIAVGIADDALSTYAVAHRSTLMLAPSMNTFMLSHPTVVQNLATLRERGAVILDSESGQLVCGDEGAGRLPDVPLIVERVRSLFFDRDLAGRQILVTAGPTREPLDPVRYLSNRSSGRMGYAIAAAARNRGATVILVSGPTSILPPTGVDLVRVTTTAEMFAAVMERVGGCHAVIKAAAVADYAPERVATTKIKKTGKGGLTLKLRETQDILAALGARSPRPILVAFAAETDAVLANAKKKLDRKKADLIVVNDVSDPTIGFDAADNEVTVLQKKGDSVHLDKAPKEVIADRILDLLLPLLPKGRRR